MRKSAPPSGAHLHPWVTPPYEEELTARNSYGGNLSRDLECAKIKHLTERIEQSFGSRPSVFKAGRFGIGPNTFAILSELGYKVDMSPAPPLNCSDDGGPDFSRMDCKPFQDPETGMLILPNSGAFCGWWPGSAAATHEWATTSWRSRLHANTIFYRSGAIKRLFLSPELLKPTDMIALTKWMLRAGINLFVISLHSPVVMAGGTPFAGNDNQVSDLLKRLSDYFEVFFGELQGEPWTPRAAFEYWSNS